MVDGVCDVTVRSCNLTLWNEAVQRVAKIVGSREAAIPPPPPFFSLLVGKYSTFLGIFFFFAKMKKKFLVAPFLVTRPLLQKHNYSYGQPD